MKPNFQNHMARFAFGLALLATPAIKAATTFTFHIDINTAALASLATSPFYLDFQLNKGDGSLANAVTISNFTFDNGSATGSPTIYSGNPSGSLSGSISLNDSSNSFNEIYQGFSSSTTGIHFNVVTTQNGFATTPDGFSVAILDFTTGQIVTTAPDTASLVTLGIGTNNSLADVGSYGSNPAGVTASATSAIPEPSTTVALFGGVVLMFAGLRRSSTQRQAA